tara:strand:- start:1918 stop:2283 length:366 start_codon:yes stop_codon:yes gene_type:complete
MVDGQYETRTFTCEKDVWEVVDLIIEETKEMNETSGKSFSPASSVKSQLPFFACNNIIFDKEFQQDIERYIYCENFKTPAFPGSYDEQPARWVQKSFLIKKAVGKIQNKAVKNGKQDNSKV